jgi:hypothetical protein
MAAGKNITAIITPTRSTTEIIKGITVFDDINVNENQVCKSPFVFQIKSDSVEMVQFRLTVKDDKKTEWSEFFEVPVKRNMPEIMDFVIADGKIFTVAKTGNDNETVMVGSGNGDGVANPGESIVILVKDHGMYRRTNLYVSDKYVNPFGINHRRSDDWMEYDYVGSSEKYSIPLIASDCPEDHTIEMFAEYWLPNYPLHIIKQGFLKIKVKCTDTTPPKLSWVQIPGDNILRVKLSDGSKIKSVKAKLILRVKDEPEKSFEIELNDDGLNGDPVSSDNVFSANLGKQKLGFYRAVIEATDSFGNTLVEEAPDKYLLH